VPWVLGDRHPPVGDGLTSPTMSRSDMVRCGLAVTSGYSPDMSVVNGT
jgi:hypothetical protein